ncbi:hypothetical protein BD626DRAFT_514142 [Schizophyllum amplum]|uniref:Uncharacterized protein n=1 Tax=Schizophyllum amplum TaxID=97359 RepID=A0A550BYL9_9AGAR|nr:hypothetical protein BD626DRAFT_514142 [Auriculariopsis ampla]
MAAQARHHSRGRRKDQRGEPSLARTARGAPSTATMGARSTSRARGAITRESACDAGRGRVRRHLASARCAIIWRGRPERGRAGTPLGEREMHHY